MGVVCVCMCVCVFVCVCVCVCVYVLQGSELLSTLCYIFFMERRKLQCGCCARVESK